MRKANFAKLGLTALVGLGSIFGMADAAHADPIDGKRLQPRTESTHPDFGITTPTTKPTIHDTDVADAVNPPEDDGTCDPWEFDCGPVDDSCDPSEFNCGPIDDPTCDPYEFDCGPVDDTCDPSEFNCGPIDDPSCDPWEFNCGSVDPSCEPLEKFDCGPVNPPGDDEPEDEPEHGDPTDPGDDEPGEGGKGGGALPRTGAEMATWAVAGLGLTGAGAALKTMGKRQS